MMLAPVVLFAYARPTHLRRTLQALVLADGAKESRLLVFSDGPRDAASVASVNAVRGILTEPEWKAGFAEVHVVESTTNKGLAKSIVEGVTQVMETYGRAIVLEDDLLVSRDFLTFMNDALDFYEDKPEVGSVTAYCPLEDMPSDYTEDVILVPRSCSHGWGSWVDRWKQVDWSGRSARHIWQERKLRCRFILTGSDKLNRLRQQIQGKSNTWSILFNLWHTLHDRGTIYPVHNRIQNIGYDGTGENCRSTDSMYSRIDNKLPSPKLTHPLREDGRIVRAFYRIYSGPWYLRAYRVIRNMRMPAELRT